MIKFNLYNIANTETGEKVKVHYYENTRHDGTPSVTIYAKGYSRNLSRILPGVINNTDTMTDYFETDKVTFTPGDKYYEAACQQARRLEEKRNAKWEAKYGKAA